MSLFFLYTLCLDTRQWSVLKNTRYLDKLDNPLLDKFLLNIIQYLSLEKQNPVAWKDVPVLFPVSALVIKQYNTTVLYYIYLHQSSMPYTIAGPSRFCQFPDS